MMDYVSRKIFIAWLKIFDDVVAYETIHMKTNEDGKMLIKRLVKGAYKSFYKILVDQVASSNLITTMQV
jgi:hypothetical protein